MTITRADEQQDHQYPVFGNAQGARDTLLTLITVLGEGAYEANIDGRLTPDELKSINMLLSRITAAVDELICKIYL